MTRAKKARQRRQQAAAPPVRSTDGGRKANPKVIAGVAGLIALAVIPVAIVLAVTGNDKSSSSTTPTNVSTLPDPSAGPSMVFLKQSSAGLLFAWPPRLATDQVAEPLEA